MKALIFSLIAFSLGCAATADERIVIQSTTSTQNSGLLAEILPKFKEDTGFQALVVAVGTGQALRNARNGDGDVLLVHAKPVEEEFVAQGYGVERFDVMYNDFVIVGPSEDPAEVSKSQNVKEVLERISSANVMFISRGDDSGTHMAERRLWGLADLDPSELSRKNYRENGSGMGATLNMAAALNGYTMSDRATWISFGNKQNLKLLFEGDPPLFNQYGVIAVNPDKFPHINSEGAQAFVGWITGEQGQSAIGAFRRGGEQLFFPNASR